MRLILLLTTLLASSLAFASDAKFEVVSVAQTGLDGDLLSGSPVSNAIDCGPNRWGSSEVSFQATITVGTTTAVTVSCEESIDNSVWVWIPYCTGAASSTCDKQELVYDVTSIPGFAVTVRPRTRYLRCTFTATGTGTISATATRVSL